MNYLLKTEPGAYSFADLQRDKTTIWDGVTNPVALKNLRNMKPGDKLVIYHTGDEKTAVGTASVVSVDPSDMKILKCRSKWDRQLPSRNRWPISSNTRHSPNRLSSGKDD